MDIETSYNFRRVSDTLTTSGVVSVERLSALRAQGYEAVINLLPQSSKYAVPDERDLVESQGLEYIHIPVDFAAPVEPDYVRFAEALDRLRGKKVHMHCAANYRVSAFYGRYAVDRELWSSKRATEFIHSIWKPADHPGWSEFVARSLEQGTSNKKPQLT